MPFYPESTLAAIKSAIDIVGLVADYGLPTHKLGGKLKALCPFHDDHNPSLEVNPERQSYKCWSCGAGGDVFSFVGEFERVDFPEAVRMLAERAGIMLEATDPGTGPGPSGPSKTDLFAVNAWAEGEFVSALRNAPGALAYVEGRGLSPEMVDRFRLGFAPDSRDWLLARAKRAGFSLGAVEAAGLVARSAENAQILRERFRGRLIFPIHDARGRAVGFGGRILPEFEQKLTESGRGVAKYLNSPETPLFKKSRNLYGVDLARPAARSAGWVAVVEGYTDVIAAHQAGLANVVGTLGTALTGDHVQALRRVADRVILVFDGDEAGQKAADRSLELFLGHEVDVRVMTLPDGLDPCDFLLAGGPAPFLDLVGRAVDPLTFAIDRAVSAHDVDSPEGARQASERVLSVLAKVPATKGAGLDLKVEKAIDTLSLRLRVPVLAVKRRLRELRGQAPARPAVSAAPAPAPISVAALDPLDREVVRILLEEPSATARVITRVTAASLRDGPLRAILQAIYDLHAEGLRPDPDRVLARLDAPALRALVEELTRPPDGPPLTVKLDPRSIEARLETALVKYEDRERRARLRDLEEALRQTDFATDPDGFRAIRVELLKYLHQSPATRRRPAS